MNTIKLGLLLGLLVVLFSSCFNDKNKTDVLPIENETDLEINNDTEVKYSSYNGLVMTGYQGWFTAEGDGSDRGWHHYQKNGVFKPQNTSIDFWPDVSEYTKTYKTEFTSKDGSAAHVYSPYDEESVDLHFKWMKEYGIDGVFMQRFVVEIKNPKGKNHFNKVLDNALKSARKYNRAISIMYDLSGSTSADLELLVQDWEEIQNKFALFDSKINPTYLHHNEKPLLAIWGIGFNDGRKYSLADIMKLVETVSESKNNVSLMLGVPYYWRTLNRDTENNALLHSIIKKADILMPWAVGRYKSDNYQSIASEVLTGDIKWCIENNIDYVPLVFPGFSWGNLKNDTTLYNSIPRENGNFFWKQVAGAKLSGVKSLYLAMFDEVDEGTALFKCLREREAPLNGRMKFMGIEDNLATDYYLWLSGEAGKWIKGSDKYTVLKPERTIN